MMPHITEIKMAMRMPMPPADIGESVTAGNGSSDLSRIFSMSYWKDTNSSIMFFTPGRKKAKLFGDSDDGMVTSFSNIDSQERTSINKRVRRLQDLMTNMDKVIVRYRNFTLNLSLQVDQRVDRCRREDRAGGWNRRQWTILTLENGRISIGGSLFTWTMLGIFCGPSSLQNNAQSNLNSGHDSLKLLFSTLKKRFTRISGHALRKIAREYEEIFLE
ncbi:uncharacterized protein LOC119276164 isoform X1 [Triticum dicoccoides]|uniref:uncharacterized protein LOC119276164 isoform X1 n=1 Tax=Triticum dicoccoides TaxID=85692 RepID=UPI00188FAF04|nr:uncharacterized protein LOC119276164 isoform X1 [Triticum dicoccoides]XP_037413058.1 uncharacterized protein LOC119276164 isoform X1 [Triticum dicoccoides]XP_037413059.1 uncharacterized protein LOC119276164 isoform X1 [Triticum dicoccoides]XP_037413060.1 uncharacterized protein LOC119276164 isoform X1 [Triticum dicoccoides]XP_037413061.1 uncharacterized protein LOC119276164 isoform X1 [Triticum dicoccoides]XP_037413062.1 uncharacterized protein LOC119276164 isoform X1 [Triticum dicoccoides]